ncbi:hypothetical protein [Nitrosomonas communis]|uniref:hypothetical protein n=1 Tax=Nitrosomonas communis TaxID=44574 RepID=UPI0011602788|nr:hypothetical protein [Nitrosomonas communis]
MGMAKNKKIRHEIRLFQIRYSEVGETKYLDSFIQQPEDSRGVGVFDVPVQAQVLVGSDNLAWNLRQWLLPIFSPFSRG